MDSWLLSWLNNSFHWQVTVLLTVDSCYQQTTVVLDCWPKFYKPSTRKVYFLVFPRQDTPLVLRLLPVFIRSCLAVAMFYVCHRPIVLTYKFIFTPAAAKPPLHYSTHHCSALHYTTHHCTALHYSTHQCSALHYTTHHCTALHCTTLHITALHYSTHHCTTLHYTTHHFSTLHYTTHHCSTLHYSTHHFSKGNSLQHCTEVNTVEQ